MVKLVELDKVIEALGGDKEAIKALDGIEPVYRMSKIDEIFDRDLFFVDHDGEYVLNLYFNHDSDCGGTLVYDYYNFDAIRNAFRESCGDYDAFLELIDGKCYEENHDVGDDPERIAEAVMELCKPTPYVGRSKETIFALMEEIGFAFRKGDWVEQDIGDGMEPLAKCSLCGYTEKVFCKGLVKSWHYCPNCGASMDEGELEDREAYIDLWLHGPVNAWNDRREDKWKEDMKPTRVVTDHEEIKKLIERANRKKEVEE